MGSGSASQTELFTNASWRKDVGSRFTTGYVVYIQDSVLENGTKIQRRVFRSTATAEHRALADGVEKFLIVMKNTCQAFCDSLQTVKNVHNLAGNQQVDGLEIDLSFV